MTELSRRDVLTVGAAGAATLLAGGRALASTGEDAAVLRRAIRIEQEAALAYAQIARSPTLPGALRKTANRFRQQEQNHAATLIEALGRLDGTPPASPTRVPGLDRALTGDQRTILEFAVSLEEGAVGFYHGAVGRLNDSRLLLLAASIMASEGQHLVVLRGALHENPVPEAFETGESH